MGIKYINDDPKNGIKYDWKKIRREYKKLKVPTEYFYPLKADFEKCGYYVAFSDRSRGKTTETLLLSMIMHQMYGTIGHYIRYSNDTITPKMLGDLFAAIIDCGYIDKITDGRWTSARYYGKRWYYCNRDDTGHIVEQSEEHFLICISLDESDRLKSSYNCPRGDIIIFDEFIQLSGYGYSDFIQFSDLVSTIFRKRLCGIIFMLSNTIDLTTPWLDELCIREQVELMSHGESRYIETSEGTHIFTEIMAADASPQRLSVNKRFFGFPNPKLAAITGRGVWATEHYPHIRKKSERNKEYNPEILFNRLFVNQSGKLLKLQLIRDDLGMCVHVFPATRTYHDSIILTAGDISDPREVFGFGAQGSFVNSVWRLYKANRFYYATNREGALIKAYIRAVQAKKQNMLI